jgi:UPF0716 family protein affecting phage T7 exclusion
MFLLALIAVPLLELAAFVAVGLSVGWLLAIALLAGMSLLGVFALRAEGRAALAGVSLAASERRSPGPAAVDAALGLLGAVLLVVPGFVTGVVGAVLLISPTRHARRTSTPPRSMTIARSSGPERRPFEVNEARGGSVAHLRPLVI